MKKILFDSGVQEFDVNGHPLRFNPSDPNVYQRFFEARTRIERLGDEYTAKLPQGAAQAETAEVTTAGFSLEKSLDFMRDIDKQVKGQLQYVFGESNDFDAIFDGVNLMAPNLSGRMVITDFFAAIEPVIRDGFERYAKSQKAEALRAAKQAREARGEG